MCIGIRRRDVYFVHLNLSYTHTLGMFIGDMQGPRYNFAEAALGEILIDVLGGSKRWPIHTDLAKRQPRLWKEMAIFSSLFLSLSRFSLSIVCVKGSWEVDRRLIGGGEDHRSLPP